MSQTYATAAAFRQALENRLLNLAQAEGVDLHRLRRQVAFDRLRRRRPSARSLGEPAPNSLSKTSRGFASAATGVVGELQERLN